MKQYADDAADLINKLQLPRLPVMGVSFGGMVAQELAIRHPDKVSKLVLACTSSGGKGGSSYPLHELEDLNSNDRLEQSIKINDLRITDDWIQKNTEDWKRLKEMTVNRNQFKPDHIGYMNQLMARKDLYRNLNLYFEQFSLIFQTPCLYLCVCQVILLVCH